MALVIDDNDLRMKLFDDGKDQFQIQISESTEDGLFVFQFVSLESIVKFVQRDGEAKFSYVVGDEANVLTGVNYGEILENHPGPVNSYLLALWDELGIAEPISLSTPEAMKAAIAILDSIQNDEVQVLQLMEELTSDSLGDRKAAVSTLSKNFYKWKYWIEKSKEKFEYDEISKGHLNKILKGSPGTIAQDFANSLDLSNPKTLLQILESASDEQQTVVVKQLQGITGEKFEEVSDWREHLSEK